MMPLLVGHCLMDPIVRVGMRYFRDENGDLFRFALVDPERLGHRVLQIWSERTIFGEGMRWSWYCYGDGQLIRHDWLLEHATWAEPGTETAP
jgi:hypothetical protein